MFEVHCDELIRSLAKRADNLRNKLMVKMCRDHQEENKKSVLWILCLRCWHGLRSALFGAMLDTFAMLAAAQAACSA